MLEMLVACWNCGLRAGLLGVLAMPGVGGNWLGSTLAVVSLPCMQGRNAGNACSSQHAGGHAGALHPRHSGRSTPAFPHDAGRGAIRLGCRREGVMREALRIVGDERSSSSRSVDPFDLPSSWEEMRTCKLCGLLPPIVRVSCSCDDCRCTWLLMAAMRHIQWLCDGAMA
jgi:hypothetical protein